MGIIYNGIWNHSLQHSLCFLFFWFNGELSTDHTLWGAFGDFIGGTLNPILSFLALIALLLTLILQSRQIEMSAEELSLSRDELSLTRKELSRSADALNSQDKNLVTQRFENTFFRLIEHLEICRKNICYETFEKPEVVGRDAIEQIYIIFTQYRLCSSVRERMESTQIFKEECKTLEGVQEEYDKFYTEKYGDDLGQYFRTIYYILKFVDEANHLENKMFYSNLLRAQLSRYELCLIFYNSISKYGEEKMAPLVKRYKILKHIEQNRIPVQNTHLLESFNT